MSVNLRSVCKHLKQFRNCKICLPHTCEKCNKIYSKEVLNSHVKKCNGVRILKSYICSLCPDSNFRDSWCLKRHYKGTPKRHRELLTEDEYKKAIAYWTNKIN